MTARALIVGDHDALLALVATVLREAFEGVQLSEARDAAAFSKALDARPWTLAVVSRDLAWADGLPLVKLLHERHPGCATLLLGEAPANQADPDAQPDVHLSCSIEGLAELGKAAQRAVARRERQRAAAGTSGDAASLPLAVLELSSEARVVACNQRAASLLGHADAAAVLDLPFSDLVIVQDAYGGDAAATLLGAAASEDGVAGMLHTAQGAAAPCRLLVRARSHKGLLDGFTVALLPGGAASGSSAEDLLYAVSHDLKQPLATAGQSARLLSDRLHQQGKLDEKEARLLRHVVAGTDRMDALMSGLLDYARTGQSPVTREPVALEAVCKEVVRHLQPQLEESGGVVRWGTLPVLEANRTELLRLMENLVTNALKFRGDEAPLIDVGCDERSNSWLISVCDNGIGINKSDAERVFEPFQRLHTVSEYPGTGIGLAICRRICERHGGRIWMEPNDGSGVTVFATIAREGAREPAREGASG